MDQQRVIAGDTKKHGDSPGSWFPWNLGRDLHGRDLRGVEARGRYPTVKPFCLLLPSPGREFRSQGEKKNPLLLCWRNVERGRRAEAQGWVSPGKSLCCAPAATRSSKHTREWLQLSSERGGTSARKSVGFCNNWQGSLTGCYCSCTTLLLVPV